MTQGLLSKLKSKRFTREMCEQLKRSAICEILPTGTPLPGTEGAGAETGHQDVITNPASAASTGATGSGLAAAASIGNGPRGPGEDTEVGEEADEDENEGVLDVASIVAGGKMNEYLAKKEKEKQDKSLAKKKGTEATAAVARPVRLPNVKREKATFMYEDHALLDTLKNMNLGSQGLADAQAAMDEGPQRKTHDDTADGALLSAVDANGSTGSASRSGPIRREIEVGTERFLAASGGVLERVADAVHRAISSVDEVNKRSELWDSLIVCGNGSRVRGQFQSCVIIRTMLTASRLQGCTVGRTTNQICHFPIISNNLYIRNSLQYLYTCRYWRKHTAATTWTTRRLQPS